MITATPVIPIPQKTLRTICRGQKTAAIILMGIEAKHNNHQANHSSVSKGCLVCGDEDHWLKDFQKGHVTKLITPEGQGNLNYIGS